ncbi:Uma2 family endonuclease [Planctomycetaceae bacterium SH139]
MLQSLHLSLHEYDAMVRKGAFDELGRKIELIRGELVEMNPAGPLHDDSIAYLNNWSVRNSDPATTRITAQTGLDLPQIDSRPQPDLFWVKAKRYREHHPRAEDVQLAIEVADSSLTKDLEVKRLLYAEAKIMEYWIVDCRSRCIHVFRDSDGTDYQTRFVVTAGNPLSPLVASGAQLDLQDLFEGN